MSTSSARTGCRLDSPLLSQLERIAKALDRIEKALEYYRHLSHVRDFVDRQNTSPVTLEMVARAIGISQSQVSRLFQEKLGISFGNWLALRRVHAAMGLMRERQISASEAANMVGFASYRSFARTFKAIVGVSPSTYRKTVEEELSRLRG